MNLSDNEKQIIEILRELKPFEIVEVHKDQLGRSDFYLVKRTQKVVLKGLNVDKVVDK